MRAPTRRSLVILSVAAVALAACGGDGDTDGTTAPQNGTEQNGAELDDVPEDALPDAGQPPEDGELPDELAEQEPPQFEEGDLEEGEALPGVRITVPDDAEVNAGPGPVGAIYQAALLEQETVVFIEAVGSGTSIEELTAGLDDLEESGQAEITEGPDEIDVPGADEAQLIRLMDASGAQQATVLLATAGQGAVSVAIEGSADTDLDPQPIIDSLELDADRLATLAG